MNYRPKLDALIGQAPDIADAIKTARELGDLAENAEYQSALRRAGPQ